MDSAFDSTERLTEHVCNFVVFETIEIQKEGIPEYFRQVMNGILNILDPQIAFSSIYDSALVHVQ